MRHAPLLFAAVAITGASFAACGVTPGRAIAVTFTAEGALPDFETAAGWRVHLTQAWMSIGPIYVLAPAAQTARLDRLRALVLPIARAHGGHDDFAALAVRAEWLDERVVDLLGGPVVLGEGDGSAGQAESTTVELAVPADTAGPTRGHVAWVAGVATPLAGGAEVAFEGGLDVAPDTIGSAVESVASAFAMDASGTLALSIHADGRGGAAPSWLEQAHFDRLPLPATGTVRSLAPGTQPYVAWYLAARDAAAFRTAYAPGAEP